MWGLGFGAYCRLTGFRLQSSAALGLGFWVLGFGVWAFWGSLLGLLGFSAHRCSLRREWGSGFKNRLERRWASPESIWEFPQMRGTLFSSPYNKDPTIFGTHISNPALETSTALYKPA